MQKKRDNSIDVIRGLAIFVMLFANGAPYILPEPHPFIFRVIDSLAAPIFVSLAGFMLSFKNENAPLFWNSKIAIRGLIIILIGAAIDVFIWGIMPFVGFDVLYIIGFGIIVLSFMEKIGKVTIFILLILILVITFCMQYLGWYQNSISEKEISLVNFHEIYSNGKAFLIFGWFPVFPWLAYLLLGYLAGKAKGIQIKYGYIMQFCMVLIFFLTTYILFIQNKITRSGYSELFYPADYIFILFSFSFLLLIFLNRSFFKNKIFHFLTNFGKSSLFIYILHAIFIQFFLVPIFNFTGKNTWFTFSIFVFIIYTIALILNYIKQTSLWKNPPFLVRFIFGS